MIYLMEGDRLGLGAPFGRIGESLKCNPKFVERCCFEKVSS
jgi:hypothetical protein